MICNIISHLDFNYLLVLLTSILVKCNSDKMVLIYSHSASANARGGAYKRFLFGFCLVNKYILDYFN